jgi:hypothetical protein
MQAPVIIFKVNTVEAAADPKAVYPTKVTVIGPRVESNSTRESIDKFGFAGIGTAITEVVESDGLKVTE